MGAQWDKLGNLIAQGIREAECSSDITDGSACHHSAEGTNLRDVVHSVFAFDVIYHLVTSGVGKVHVNIWRGRAVWVQEAFETKIIFQRVNIGNAGKISDD